MGENDQKTDDSKDDFDLNALLEGKSRDEQMDLIKRLSDEGKELNIGLVLNRMDYLEEKGEDLEAARWAKKNDLKLDSICLYKHVTKEKAKSKDYLGAAGIAKEAGLIKLMVDYLKKGKREDANLVGARYCMETGDEKLMKSYYNKQVKDYLKSKKIDDAVNVAKEAQDMAQAVKILEKYGRKEEADELRRMANL